MYKILFAVYSHCPEADRKAFAELIEQQVKDIGTLTMDRLELWTTYGPLRSWECLGTWILPE